MIISILAIAFIIPIQASAQTATTGEWKTLNVRTTTSPVGSHDATIRYKLSTGEIGIFGNDSNGKLIKREEIIVDPYFQSLSTNILSNSSGTLVLELPRTVIDSKMPNNVTDAPFTAFFSENGHLVEANIHELNTTATMRTVSIDFPLLGDVSAYNFSIRGTYAIPEFDENTPLLVLSLASVVILSLKFRNFGSDKRPDPRSSYTVQD